MYWIRNYVKTEKTGKNRRANEEAIQPFPADLPYVKVFVESWQNNDILHIIKSRQMSVSWLCQIMMTWEAQFRDHSLEIVINKSEAFSIDSIRRCKVVYENQPEWLRNSCPLDRKMDAMPGDGLFFANGSKIIGLPQGAHKIRSLVPSTVMIDEAVFNDELEATFAAAVPCASKIVTVSSAGPGYFRKLCVE